jgi:hypothetical protein
VTIINRGIPWARQSIATAIWASIIPKPKFWVGYIRDGFDHSGVLLDPLYSSKYPHPYTDCDDLFQISNKSPVLSVLAVCGLLTLRIGENMNQTSNRKSWIRLVLSEGRTRAMHHTIVIWIIGFCVGNMLKFKFARNVQRIYLQSRPIQCRRQSLMRRQNMRWSKSACLLTVFIRATVAVSCLVIYKNVVHAFVSVVRSFLHDGCESDDKLGYFFTLHLAAFCCLTWV